MTRRQHRTEVEPHVRLQDAFYWLLKNMTPPETKLYFALRFQAWRANGKRKNYISKSLRRIAKEIAMPWSTAGRAMQGLQQKGFVSWRPSGIYLPELKMGSDPPLFSYDFDTAFDTFGHRETNTKVAHIGPGVAQIGTKVAQIGTKVAHIGPPTPNKHPNFHRVTGARNDLEKRSRETVQRNARVSPPFEGGGGRATEVNSREGVHDTMEKQAPPEIKKRLRELQDKMGWKIPSSDTSPKRSREEQEQFEQRRRAELARQRAELEKGETTDADQDPDHDSGA